MNETWYTRKWMLLLVLGLGVAIAVVMNKSQPPLQHQANDQKAIPVQTLEVQRLAVRPAILGYGEVEPDVVMEARAEVSGRITYIHPELNKGAVLAKDTLVMKIDEQDYQLALRQAEASLVQSEANLKQQQLTLDNARADLGLAKDKLSIAKSELARLDNLFQKGSVSRSGLDGQRTTVLQLQQEVQALSNTVTTLPQQIQVQKAQMDIANAEVATQQRNLARTSLTLPYTARITAVNSESNEFVSQGTPLFSAQTIDRVRINAQFPLQQFRLLAKGFQPIPDFTLPDSADSGIQQTISRLGLSATVRLTGDFDASWQGTVEQISNNLDPESRTLGVTIIIEDPYKNLQPGVRPPLLEGMFTEVRLQGTARDYLVIPRDAVHQGEVYLVDTDQRLQRKAVSGYPMSSVLLLETGLEPGDQLITSDVFPAVPNMRVDPVPDQESNAALLSWLESH